MNHICSHCEKEFTISGWQRHVLLHKPDANVYCSKECKSNSRKKEVNVKCVQCSKDFITYPGKIRRNKIGVFCSSECYDIYKKETWRKVELVCPTCNKQFTKKSGLIKYGKSIRPETDFFCSKECHSISMKTDASVIHIVKCDHCKVEIQRPWKFLKNQDLHFCNKSCRASYFCKLYNTGHQRSQLELKIEQHIKNKYPDLVLNVNDRDMLNGLELDFYIPSLQLAIEINGPAHFKSIYGDESLIRTQRHDLIKQKWCTKNGIRLLTVTDLLNYNIDNSSEIFEKYIDPIIDDLTEYYKKSSQKQ